MFNCIIFRKLGGKIREHKELKVNYTRIWRMTVEVS